MKNRFFKTILIVSAIAMVSACSDDSSSTEPQQNPIVSDSVVVLSDAYIYVGSTTYVIYPDGIVSDASGNTIGYFDNGTIMDLTGAPLITGIDLNTLEIAQPNAVKDPNTGVITFLSSSSAITPISSATIDPLSSAVIDPLSSAVIDLLSSAVIDPLSSATIDPLSSAVEPVSSSSVTLSESSSSGVSSPGGSIDSYPVPTLNSLLLSNGSGEGWSSRYWDACRAHCSQLSATDTSSQAAYEAAGTVARTCNIKGYEIPVFTIDVASLTNEYWTGWKVVGNSCNASNQSEGIASTSDGAFACMDMAPIQVNDTLSYGFVASAPNATACGECFHLQFNGGAGEKGHVFYHDGDRVKASHTALKGKHMIVMSSNIGTDVEEGQFDMMVPGGGVGMFDALSTQVGVNMAGFVQYGGFLSTCQQELPGMFDSPLADLQNCVKNYCAQSFTGFPDLLRGCNWFADWYMAADNPSYYWEKVECPQYLVDKYKSTYNTTRRNDYKPHDSWADFTGGELEKAGKYTGDGTN